MTHLPWLFMGRRIKPYAASLIVACVAIVFGTLIVRNLAGATFDNLSPAGGYATSAYDHITAFTAWVTRTGTLTEGSFVSFGDSLSSLEFYGMTLSAVPGQAKINGDRYISISADL